MTVWVINFVLFSCFDKQNGTSLIRTFLSREGHVIRQKLCMTIANTMYQWMVGSLGIESLKFISLSDPPLSSGINITVKDFKILISDKRVRVILRKILESAKSDRILMLRFCWTSFVMFLTTTALACHRFVISVSEGYINYLSLSAPVALRTWTSYTNREPEASNVYCCQDPQTKGSFVRGRDSIERLKIFVYRVVPYLRLSDNHCLS